MRSAWLVVLMAAACQGSSKLQSASELGSASGSGSGSAKELPGWATTEPPKPKFGEPAGDLAARKFLDAASTGDKEGLMHVLPDAEACKALKDFPECPQLQPALTTNLAHIKEITAPYASAALIKLEGEPPLPGGEVWIAQLPDKPDLIIIAFPANGRYFALARVADGGSKKAGSGSGSGSGSAAK